MSKSKAILCSVVAIVILIVSQIVSGLLAGLLQMVGVPSVICIIFNGAGYIALTLIAVKLFCEKVMHVDLAELGITGFSIKTKWILIAFLLPIAVVAVYLLLIPGEYVSAGMDRKTIVETLLAGVFCTGFGAGFVEEIVFRGVIFRSLQKAFNTKIGVIAPSLLFGIVHILGMDFSVVSCLLVILAGTAVGIMFSMITIDAESVWCNGLVHALWNIIIIGGGIAVASQPAEGSIMTYVTKTDSFLITGGEFGIESSIISLLAYLAVIAIAFVMIGRKKGGQE